MTSHSCRKGRLRFAWAALAWAAVLLSPLPGEADEVAGGEIDLEQLRVPDFVVDDGRDLRRLTNGSTRSLLTPVTGRGTSFGPRQEERYCRLKRNPAVQWVVNDLASGEILSRSPNADQLFFGASTSKIFVAGAVLDKHGGKLDAEQLRLLVRMIVVSDNGAWKSLQRQTGDAGTDDAGRAAVDAFVRRMGYPTIRGFQGWMRKPDGTSIHGNELNAVEVSQFLRDTYRRKYPGADVLWKVMQATKTGKSKIDKYTPATVYIAGKTGTYSGSNESRRTIDLPSIQARNHAAVVTIDNRYYGITVLSNTGDNEDVAVLAGGLMREYLGVSPTVACP